MDQITITRTDVEDAINDAGLGMDDVHVRHGYSGRGMYGDKCFGIDFETNADMIAFVAAFSYRACQKGEDIPEWLRDVRTDDMGRGIVAYWPRVALEGLPSLPS